MTAADVPGAVIRQVEIVRSAFLRDEGNDGVLTSTSPSFPLDLVHPIWTVIVLSYLRNDKPMTGSSIRHACL